jgi:hypothetical protein
LDDALEQEIRPMTEADLIIGLHKVRRTGEAAYKYGRQSNPDDALSSETPTTNVNAENIDIKTLQNIAKLLRALSSIEVPNSDDGEIPNL